MHLLQTKLDWQEIFSYAELLSILFAALGFIAGLFYAFGGLVVDALTTIGWVAPETFGTNGLGWGTVLAFEALIGMPLLFGAVGWGIGFLIALIVRLRMKKTDIQEEESCPVSEDSKPTPLDTNPIKNLDMLEAFFEQLEQIDTRFRAVFSKLPEKERLEYTDLSDSNRNGWNHVSYIKEIELEQENTDIYWEFSLECNFDKQGFYIGADTGFITRYGQSNTRYFDDDDKLYTKEELTIMVKQFLDFLFCQIDEDIKTVIAEHEEFLAVEEATRQENLRRRAKERREKWGLD
ncbi:MAG: hypothetical protein AAFP70_00160 [Calditrichota bacterium]